MDTVTPHASQSKPNPDTTFIYALIDPRDNAIRYIGKSNTPQQRMKRHMSDGGIATYKGRWIKGLISLNLEPLLKIIEEVPIEKWEERECYWIQYYRAQGAPLTNGTDGGDGMTSPTPELRAHLSAIRKGKKRPPEVGAKVSAARKGKPLSDEAKAKMSASRTGKKYPNISASMKGKKLSPESIEKRSATVRGRKRPPEVGAKVSAARTGKKREPFSQEWRENIGKAQLGKKHSPEAIAKMAASKTGKKASSGARANISLGLKKAHAMKKSPSPDTPTLWD